MLWILAIIVVFLLIVGSIGGNGTTHHHGCCARDGRWYPYKETPSQYRSRKMRNSFRHF